MKNQFHYNTKSILFYYTNLSKLYFHVYVNKSQRIKESEMNFRKINVNFC